MTKSRNLIRPKHAWTGFELDALRRLFPTGTTSSLAKLLGLPVHVVQRKAQALGLEKSPEFLASPASGRLDGVRGMRTTEIRHPLFGSKPVQVFAIDVSGPTINEQAPS
jgi:hypothetical protein